MRCVGEFLHLGVLVSMDRDISAGRRPSIIHFGLNGAEASDAWLEAGAFDDVGGDCVRANAGGQVDSRQWEFLGF